MYGYIKTKNSNHESLQIKKWFHGKKHEELEFLNLQGQHSLPSVKV